MNALDGPPRVAVAHVLARLGIALSPEEFLERRRPILHELLAQAEPIRGAPELIERLVRARVAARRLGVDITDSIVFEDSPAGLSAARDSGASVFPVTCADGLSRAG